MMIRWGTSTFKKGSAFFEVVGGPYRVRIIYPLLKVISLFYLIQAFEEHIPEAYFKTSTPNVEQCINFSFN